MAHGIFRGDNVTSITDPAKIRTIQVYADIDNGAPILLGALASSGKYAGEAEVFTTATANGAAAANVWVVQLLRLIIRTMHLLISSTLTAQSAELSLWRSMTFSL